MTNRNKIYTAIAIFSALSLVLAGFAYTVFSDVENISGGVLSDKNRAVLIESQDAELDAFSKNYTNYQPNFQKIDQLFVDPQNPVSFIQFLESTADTAGVTIDINLNDNSVGQKIDGLPSILFDTSIKGSFPGTMEFMQQIETGPYLISIQSAAMKNMDQAVVGSKPVSKPVVSQVETDLSIVTLSQ